jgi:hypothetical protein
VVEAYRFELEQALAKQERVVWATTPLTPVNTLTELPTARQPNLLQWQTAFNELTGPAVQLHAYLTNGPDWTEAPRLHVPAGFVLHATDLPARKAPLRSVALASGKQLTIGTDHRLRVVAAVATTEGVVATAPLRVLLQFRQAGERTTVRAALGALTTVYGLTFHIDDQAVAGTNYAWVLTDRAVANPSPTTLYTLTGQSGNVDGANVVYIPDPLMPQTNERVLAGQLPEWLADQLITHLGLSAGPAPLSQQQLATLFVADKTTDTGSLAARSRNRLQTGLLVLFLGLLLVERYLAIQRQA